jgi:hypothetical protein
MATDLVLALKGSGGSQDNGVDGRVWDLGADEVVDAVTTSMAVVGRKRSLLPETDSGASLVVDGHVRVSTLLLGLDHDDAVLGVAVVASDHLAGERSEFGDGA